MPAPLRDVLTVLVLTVLAACSAKDVEAQKSQDAARWLQQACGITFAQNPVVLKNSSAPRRGASSAVVATVVLPDAEVAAALESLARNRSLHRRGNSASRHSYESYPGTRPESECELDTSLHVLYFSYTE